MKLFWLGLLAIVPLAVATTVDEVVMKPTESEEAMMESLEEAVDAVEAAEGKDEDTVKNETEKPVLIWKDPIPATDNYTQLLAGIEDLRAIVQPDYAKDIAVKSSQTILETVENFDGTVQKLVHIINDLESRGGIPEVMIPVVNFVKMQLEDAATQANDVILELSDSIEALQISDGMKDRAHRSSVDDGRDTGAQEGSHVVAQVSVNSKGKQHYQTGGDRGGDERNRQSKNSHHHHYEKLRTHPKMRQHLEMHDAMMSGDFEFVHRTMERIQRQHETSEQSERRLSQSVSKECRKLVACIEEWSLYDVVAWFYGPYVDEQGKLEDNVVVADAKGDEGIENVIKNVQKKLKEAKSKYAEDKCESLLHEFHVNENKDDFAIYHGATVSKVCRAQGSTKYIQISEIRDKIGGAVADNLFDDLVKCASNLGDSTFFDGNTPRIPTSVSQDRHGATKSITVESHFSYQATSPVSGATRGRYRLSYDQIRRRSATCIGLINEEYAKMYKKHETAIFKHSGKKIEYPRLQIKVSPVMRRVYIGIGDSSSNPRQICEITSTRWEECPHREGLRINSGEVFEKCGSGIESFDVNGLFSGFGKGDRDKASRLALGEQMSVGMVCAYSEKAKSNRDRKAKKVPGWCCIDSPADSGSFGKEYMCDQGERACKRTAPALAGLSQSACDPWSGKWCPYPRSCRDLINCVKGEVNWAKQKKKTAYSSYLKAAPEVKDKYSLAECGDLREYFGFKADYPLDDEICEDITFLRTNRNFDNLEDNFGSGSVDKSGDGPPPKQELIEPEEPETTEEMYEAFDTALMAMEITLYGLESAEKISGYFECPSDQMGLSANICMGIKNALTIASVQGVAALETVMETVEENIPAVSNHEQFQIYHNVDILYKNMQIMNDGIGNIRVDIHNLKQEKRHLVEHGNSYAKFSGCDGLDQDLDGISDNCEEDFSPPELVIPPGTEIESIVSVTGTATAHSVPDKIFQSGEAAKSYLERVLRVADDCAPESALSLNLTLVNDTRECGSIVRAAPIHYCDKQVNFGIEKNFHVQVDSSPPAVLCGFDSPHTLDDDKTVMILEEADEGSLLVDTGFFYNISESCSNQVNVDVSVHSNEFYAAGGGSLMAKAAVMHAGNVSLAKVFVSPLSCQQHSQSQFQCGGVCVGSGGRSYEIRVSATDEAGWTSQEICRVVVVPRNAASSGFRALANEQQFGKDTPTYEIDRVALTWTNN
ncbi:expressed unknown protein [Seminavis robusta]|uniref:Uncharacterized protein n=1 Tax=Seminavis robusta TaxID=568900 RepID=A0A9N8DKJ7_9STRA|nr:expressed unknown protein [Seminavis robusta]|eukprot:Sro133_g063210.1 n/a (1223) ;mRNA; r:92745-98189